MTEFRTAHCDLTEKTFFFNFFHRNDKTSEGRRFKLWKKNFWIPLFKASFCSLPPLWPTVQFKTRHGDLDQTSWHPWHTCSTCQCWTNWQVRISNDKLKPFCSILIPDFLTLLMGPEFFNNCSFVVSGKEDFWRFQNAQI